MPAQRGPTSDGLLQQLCEPDRRTADLERLTLLSTSVRLGRTLVLAAKHPSKLLRLPVEFWRRYRGRGQRAGVENLARACPERLLTFYRSLEREGGGVLLAVVASRRTIQALRGTFDVVPLWPHDAKQVASAVTPDLVLLESGASMPGEAWSGLGTAAEAGLGELLADTIQGFQGRSVPVVFWWTTPVDLTADLSALVERCDWIASDPSVPGVPDAASLSPGVDLSGVEPLRPAEQSGPTRPLIHLGGYEPDPRTSPANRLVEAAVEGGARIMREPSHLYADNRTLRQDDIRLHYRRASWTTPTTDLSHRCLTMLASGVPVLVNDPPAAMQRIVDEVPSGENVLEVVDEARRRIGRPQHMAEILRTVHQYATTRQQFCGVLEYFGLVAERSDNDAIGVLVDADSDAARAVEVIAEQSVQPVEVLVRNEAARLRLSADLQATGIPVRPANDAKAARHAIWSGGPWHQTYLHDLLVVSQVAGTDRLSDSEGIVMSGSKGVVTALPWWISEAQVG